MQRASLQWRYATGWVNRPCSLLTSCSASSRSSVITASCAIGPENTAKPSIRICTGIDRGERDGLGGLTDSVRGLNRKCCLSLKRDRTKTSRVKLFHFRAKGVSPSPLRCLTSRLSRTYLLLQRVSELAKAKLAPRSRARKQLILLRRRYER